MYEIAPEEPYTDGDLNWNDENSRCSREHNDHSIRPAIRGGEENMDKYDVGLLGYPIWWGGDAPLIIRTFLERYDFTGKTIIPFCTSAFSSLGDSGTHLHKFAPDTLWQEGTSFASRPGRDEAKAWADRLDLPKRNGSAAAENAETEA